MSFFKKMFEKGVEVEAVIKDIWFYKDRGRVEYNYVYKDNVYDTGNAVLKTKILKSLKKNDKVIVHVQPSKSNKAIIRDLYTI